MLGAGQADLTLGRGTRWYHGVCMGKEGGDADITLGRGTRCYHAGGGARCYHDGQSTPDALELSKYTKKQAQINQKSSKNHPKWAWVRPPR